MNKKEWNEAIVSRVDKRNDVTLVNNVPRFGLLGDSGGQISPSPSKLAQAVFLSRMLAWTAWIWVTAQRLQLLVWLCCMLLSGKERSLIGGFRAQHLGSRFIISERRQCEHEAFSQAELTAFTWKRNRYLV